MSDETSSPSPELSPDTTPEVAPKARRVSTPKAKKAAKSAPAAESAPEALPEKAAIEAPAPPVKEEVPVAVLDRGEGTEVRDDSGNSDSDSDEDWPEPDAPATGGNSQQGEGGKRKRRRRKGKGQNGPAPAEEVHSLAPADTKPQEQGRPPESTEQRPRPQQNPPQHPQHPQHPQQQQRPRIEPEILAKKAWKIYLAEVSEEGVALIGDNDARELSRRCFKLAEIFIEEQMRRR